MTRFDPLSVCRGAVRLLLLSGLPMALFTGAAGADEPKAADTSYGEQLKFLGQHTHVVELFDGRGARVAICPQWQGRVMTSTCHDAAGPGFGWINREFITADKPSAAFNNYGGEDRFWLSPEGGQFALFFAPGVEQTVANWITPPDLNDGHFKVTGREAATGLHMSRRVRVSNYSHAPFDLEVAREIRLQSPARFGQIFGSAAATALADKRLRMVGYSSHNTISNLGQPTRRTSGLVSIWILGQFPAGDQTAIIVPYRAGPEQQLGPVVNSDYFGNVPPDRLKITPTAILFRGDGQYRSKIGTSARRVKPMAGSIDFRTGVLTLVHFSMPQNPAAHLYLNNTWKVPQAEPLAGDVFNSYNDGPPEPGAKALGGFYELETLSPAAELPRGGRLSHEHSTFHVQGDLEALAPVAKAALGVDLEEARKMVAP